ncbi:MAG TPA: aspartate aminotransferase family protein, partial [Rhodospirillales bacterium]|nr:aspartate aminotransferase family protein [Rhodospirillales bacterium]
MDIARFRERAHALVEHMATYLDEIEKRPVRSRCRPGEVAAALPTTAPEEPEPFEALLADLERIVLPGLTHWQHPRFLAYFPANSSPPSVLAEMLTATYAVNAMLWQTSPAATEMETTVLDWLRRAIGLPDGFSGVIQSTASEATLCALLAARERALDWRGNEEGLAGGPPLAVYASAEAHSSVEKGVTIAGFGRRFFRRITVGEDFALRPEALEAAIRTDLDAGVRPCCVVATLGTTGVGASDPLEPVGEICARHGIYLHVDAAWAGSALLLPEWRHLAAGVERADSFVFNPHKWLLTNFDCSAHFLRRPEDLIRTLSILPAYLRGRETGSVIDYRDWGIPLGRRFRALKLWFVLRSYGLEGLRAMLRRHIALARELAGWIREAPDFELVTGPNLALLTFRYHPEGAGGNAALDALNERLLNAVNDDGRTYLTPGRVHDRYVLRVSIGQARTERRHVEEAWRAITEIARGL